MLAVMADEIQSGEGQDPEIPARLAEALKRAQPPHVEVPPHVDAAALSRAKLHLSQVRQQPGARNQELPLAAHSRERAQQPRGFTAEHRGESDGTPFWTQIFAIFA